MNYPSLRVKEKEIRLYKP